MNMVDRPQALMRSPLLWIISGVLLGGAIFFLLQNFGALNLKGDIVDPTVLNTAPEETAMPPMDSTAPIAPSELVLMINGQNADGQTFTSANLTLNFSWQAAQDMESGIALYRVRLANASNNGALVESWVVPGTQTTLTTPISGLASGNTYVYSVYAQNEAQLGTEFIRGGQFIINTTGNCIGNPRNDLSVLSFTVDEGSNTSLARIRNNSPLCAYNLALSSYRVTVAWDGGNAAAYLAGQRHFALDADQIGILAPGNEITLQIALPDCQYQVDLFEYHNTDPVLMPPDFGANAARFTLFDWKQNHTRGLCGDIPEEPGQNPAFGFHDAATCTATIGWACDLDSANTALKVELYDGPLGQGGVLLGSTLASQAREKSVATACGGIANHGFSFPIPAALLDGREHKIYAYTDDIQNQDGAIIPGKLGKRLLTNSPRTITCGGTPENFTIVKTATPTQIQPGADVTYTITIKNNGSQAATSLGLTDEMQAGTTGGTMGAISAESIAWSGGTGTASGSLAQGQITFGNFPAGATAVVTYKRKAPTTGIASGSSSTFVNTARLFRCT